MVTEDKQRSFAQRVGTAGELQYRALALRQHLTATKIEEDFGVDFASQAEESTDAKSANAMIPAQFGACVRATQAADGRVKLNRKDATNLLRFRQPLVFVLVHLIAEVAPCYYRFVDADFGARLAEFLESGNDEMTLTPNDCRPETTFRDDLVAALRPSATRRTQISLAQLRIKSLVPGATVAIQMDEDREVTIILADDYYDFFEQLPEEQRNSVYRAAFGRPDLFDERSTRFQFKSAIPDAFVDAPEHLVIGGGLVSEQTSLEVNGADGSAAAPFTYTRIGTHYGWVHKDGLGLTVSASKVMPDGTRVHETRTLIDDEADCPLDDMSDQLRALLIAAVPDAMLRDTEGSFTMQVDYFGLPAISEVIRAHADANTISGWDPSVVQLRDLKDPITRDTIMWLGTWAAQISRFPKLNFYAEFPSQPISLDEVRLVDIPAAVSAVLDTVRATVVATVSGVATERWHDGACIGLSGFEAQRIELATLERARRTEAFPEILLSPEVSIVLDPSGMRVNKNPFWIEGLGYRPLGDELGE